MTYYHVTREWDGDDLESLHDRYGDDAYEMYIERWPDAGAATWDHAGVIHLHDTMDQAREMIELWGDVVGTQILVIDGEGLPIERDGLEYDHPICRERIPAACITIAQEETV